MDQNDNEYVSLVRIPRKWFYVFVWTFSILIIANTLVDISTDWTWQNALGETLFTRMAVLMTLIVGWFFILSHIWEAIMLGYAKAFKDKILAQGEAKVINALQEAQKKGIPLEQALETYKSKNGKKSNKNTASK